MPHDPPPRAAPLSRHGVGLHERAEVAASCIDCGAEFTTRGYRKAGSAGRFFPATRRCDVHQNELIKANLRKVRADLTWECSWCSRPYHPTHRQAQQTRDKRRIIRPGCSPACVAELRRLRRAKERPS